VAVRRTGSSSGARVTVEGLDEFRRELRKLGPQWGRQLRDVHKRIARRVDQWSEANARAGHPIQRAKAHNIRSSATASDARVGVASGPNTAAGVAFWGVKRRLGWYAARRYENSAPQNLPEWVGNTWDTGVRGQGPYAINLAVAEHLREIEDEYLEQLDRLSRRAFPDGRGFTERGSS
jgi:hypothetical protein